MHSCTIFGGKARLAAQIVPSIVGLARGSSGDYYEPFVGGGSILEEVCNQDAFMRLHGSDLQPDLIRMWQALVAGWEPPREVSEETYAQLRSAPVSPLRGFVGFACSFSGKWFGGYARDGAGKTRSFANSGANVCMRKAAAFRRARVRLSCRSYLTLKPPPGSVVYLDPPYRDTEEYDAHEETFDHGEFWGWCREQERREVRLIVSESTPPPFDDWGTVWWTRREIQVTRQAGSAPGEIFDGLFVPRDLLSLATPRLRLDGGIEEEY